MIYGFSCFQLFSLVFNYHAKNLQNHAKNVAGMEKGCIFAAQFNFLTYGNNIIITIRKGGQDNGEI